jgi:DNA-binding NarL/FixJ family response regulator
MVVSEDCPQTFNPVYITSIGYDSLFGSKQGKNMPTICPYRVVLADDHAIFRQYLKRILMARSDMDVAGEAGDGLELLAILALTVPAAQMAIVDITMPNIGGIKATATIKRTCPATKVLILSIHREKQYVQEALSAGADGYLLKEDADIELFPAIEKIRRGGIYLSLHLNEMECF